MPPFPLLVASSCSVFATAWSLRVLWVAATAVNLQPQRLLHRKLAGRHKRPDLNRRIGLDRLDRAMQMEADTWEAQLVRTLVRTKSRDEAQAEVNAALLDVDGCLSTRAQTYAACARIAVFGGLIGAAWLFMTEPGLTTSVLDLFAIGAAGVLCTLAAGREARRIVREKRQALDDWSDDLVRACGVDGT